MNLVPPLSSLSSRLTYDSSRGITDITYNQNGQPKQIIAGKSRVDYKYNADGSVNHTKATRFIPSRNAYIITERTYCGDFVFEGDSITMVNFPGGYFDGDGNPHYRHLDWQSSVMMTTDSKGDIEQHTGYYPYGEPWLEPSGQPYLYSGKERLRDLSLND